MTWFETLTGFSEEHPQQVRENISVDGQTLTSHGNGKVLVYGQLETPTLAAYEATICTAILNAMCHGSNTLFLTLLGGGAFGNETAWIIAGIQRALTLYKDMELDVAIVSYGSPNRYIQQLVSSHG
jgi:hypothetical protein